MDVSHPDQFSAPTHRAEDQYVSSVGMRNGGTGMISLWRVTARSRTWQPTRNLLS